MKCSNSSQSYMYRDYRSVFESNVYRDNNVTRGYRGFSFPYNEQRFATEHHTTYSVERDCFFFPLPHLKTGLGLSHFPSFFTRTSLTTTFGCIQRNVDRLWPMRILITVSCDHPQPLAGTVTTKISIYFHIFMQNTSAGKF